MHITAANTGDLLCLYQTGEWVRVLDANDRYVVFQQEDGQRYASNERRVDAFVERDPARISAFNDNCRLGQVLHAAELGALKAKLREERVNGPERCSADRVISIVQEHWEKMFVEKQQHQEAPSKSVVRAFLSQLYEMGTGSHDTFFGCRVENLSQHHGTFLINGASYDYHAALQFLSSGTREPDRSGSHAVAAGRRVALNDLIRDADKRKVPAAPDRQGKKFEKEFY